MDKDSFIWRISVLRRKSNHSSESMKAIIHAAIFPLAKRRIPLQRGSMVEFFWDLGIGFSCG